ncbi:MAG: hypothetical protein AAF449_17390 [Myxococcota bacterium]
MMITATFIAVVGQNPPAEIRHVALQGKIREISGGPAGRTQAQLIAPDARYILHALDPGLRGELKRLAGLVVRVRGVIGDPRAPAADHVLVQDYKILALGRGIVPRVGRLALLHVGDARRLVFVDEQGQADLLPQGWSRKLAHHAGAKVWMVGHRDNDGSFRPQRFAILRPRPEKPRPEKHRP